MIQTKKESKDKSEINCLPEAILKLDALILEKPGLFTGSGLLKNDNFIKTGLPAGSRGT